MSGSRDYITNTVRLAGPAPGTGEQDVQIADNTDFIFGDNEELKFGDDGDVGIKWDGADLAIGVAAGSVVLTSTLGAISGEERSLDIISTAILSSGDALVGLNVAVTPAGDAGAWVAAIFGKVTEVAAAPGPVGGYFCGAEFEVNITGSQPSAYAVLVLNSNADNSTYGQTEAYVFLREYGSKAVRSLFNFMDHSRESESNSVIVSQTGSKPFDTMIRCTIGSAGTTGLWLLASSGGPADADIDFKMLGAAASNYMEWDASGNVLNLVKAGMTFTGALPGHGINFTGATLTDSNLIRGTGLAPARTSGWIALQGTISTAPTVCYPLYLQLNTTGVAEILGIASLMEMSAGASCKTLWGAQFAAFVANGATVLTADAAPTIGVFSLMAKTTLDNVTFNSGAVAAAIFASVQVNVADVSAENVSLFNLEIASGRLRSVFYLKATGGAGAIHLFEIADDIGEPAQSTSSAVDNIGTKGWIKVKVGTVVRYIGLGDGVS